MTLVNHIARYAAGGIGVLWCAIEPTLPWAFICILFVIMDCVSAARLNHRVAAAVKRGEITRSSASGKFESRHAMKIISTLSMIYGCILLAQLVDVLVLDFYDLHLGNYVAAAFCFITALSILENESSQNGSEWARLLQKFLVDKTERHLNLDLDGDHKIGKDNDLQ